MLVFGRKRKVGGFKDCGLGSWQRQIGIERVFELEDIMSLAEK